MIILQSNLLQRLLDASLDERREVFRRAIRSVPGSGEVWARYIRFLVIQFVLSAIQDYSRFLKERLASSGEQYDGMETVAGRFAFLQFSIRLMYFLLTIDVFDHALAMKIVQKDASQLVPLVLARAGYERRQLDESNEGMLSFQSGERFTRFHR